MADRVIVLDRPLFLYDRYELIPPWVYSQGVIDILLRFHLDFHL